MHLARNSQGRIGRQVPSPSEVAVVRSPAVAERRGNLYLSEGQIEDDHRYYAEQEAQERAQMAGMKLVAIRNKKAQMLENIREQKRAREHQAMGARDPMNEMLKRHFARQMGTSESEKVMNSLRHDVVQGTPDFASDSSRPEIVLSNEDKRPITWRADFRQHLIVGNPLTRDGVFGPSVTDYDRYVQGTDVNEEIVQVAGGTILGRYGGEQMTETWEHALAEKAESNKAQVVARAEEMRSHGAFEMWLPTIDVRPMPNLPIQAMATGLPPGLAKKEKGMGWEMPSWGDVTDWAGGVVDQTADNLSDALPAQLSKEIQQLIAGGASVQTSPTGQITVTRPSTMNNYAQSMGIPSWALYGGLGLMGVGVLLLLVKAVK